MKKFIELSGRKGIVTINPFHVIAIEDYSGNDSDFIGGSTIWVGFVIDVKESRVEITQLINGLIDETKP